MDRTVLLIEVMSLAGIVRACSRSVRCVRGGFRGGGVKRGHCHGQGGPSIGDCEMGAFGTFVLREN